MKLNLKGIIPPIITPLKNDNEIDKPGLKNLIEHLISGGVHGIFLLGTTGEASSLSYSLRKAFIKEACKQINKRVPVLVGITDTTVSGSLEIANTAFNEGADALVLSAPYYLPVSQIEFREYLEFLVPKLPLPFMVYNMPSCTKFNMEMETIKRAKELGAMGIKDSSGNWEFLQSVVKEFRSSPEFVIMCGSENFIPELIKIGGHGGVPGGANMFPRLYVQLYNASLLADNKKTNKLLEQVIHVHKTIYDVGKYSSKYIKSIKCVLALKGICNDHVSQPFVKFAQKEKEQIASTLEKIQY